MTSFANDVKPMFTTEDIEHMLALGVKLDDYAYMSDATDDHAHAKSVYEQVSAGKMPPGSPWPAANVTTFQAWMHGGYQP